MWILPLLGYVGVILGFAFLTLAIASGLYYLSELVEEHTVLAKKLLYRLIYGVVGIQVLLLVVDRFPIGLSALSVVSHVIYAQNLRRFPIVKLTDPLFLVSCALVIANHYLWFRHFSAPPANTYSSYPYSRDVNIPTFTEIASYFGLCVWLVPFALFVSLSAGENVLPSMGSEYATGDGSSYIMPGKAPESFGSGTGIGVGGVNSGMEGKRRARSGTNAGMAKAVVTGVREWVMSPSPPSFVNLPSHFHPILVDQVVSFIYTSDYKFFPGLKGDQLKQSTVKFHHATLIPNEDSPSPATVALVGIVEHAYHLHIYALAEELDYDALKSAAHAKLVGSLIFRTFAPDLLMEIIKTIFAPAGTAERICRDEDGALQQLVVAAVLAHEAKYWTEAQLTDFSNNIQGPEYEDFRNIYTAVKEETGEFIKQAAIAKQLAAERRNGRELMKAANSKRANDDKNKIFGSDGSPMGALGARPISMKDKFKRRHEGKRAVAGFVNADRDGDMDMEVD
ncbi:hypothetical protein ACET3X_008353 [Alternaria dauci]|uniref:DUF396-domain-containing protein n=1 Tax=Alternaria dauci TaxID=48095 RepID=A0ABR3UCP2_9PLEO